MTFAAASTERPEAPLFSDGIGDRVVASDGATGELLQILRLRPALTAVPSFEFALRERTARLANFRHSTYSRVRRIDRAMAPTPSLAVVSDHVEGIRLSELLRVAESKRLQLDINAALCLIRQLVPAVALLHENARDVGHGLIAPERLVVTPHARLLIVEHVLGAAVEQLHWSRERLWREFRVAVPPSAGIPRLDHRADVTGLGVVALSLLAGRPLAADEFPQQVPMLLESARESDGRPLSQGLRHWLARALQLDVRRAFASAPEAAAALDEALADEPAYVAAPVALETFLSRYIEALIDDLPAPKPPVAPVAAPAPVVAAAPAPASRATYAPSHAPSHPPLAASPSVSDLVDLSDLAIEPAKPATSKALFADEEPFPSPAAPPVAAASGGSRSRKLAIAGVVLLAVLGGGGFVAWKMFGGRGADAPGTLVVQSNPAGVQVFVDGVERGVTPARLSLAPGAHILELRGKGVPRVIPLTVTSGAEASQYLEFADSPATGSLAVSSEPSGARVILDGTERGVAPLTIADLAPGEHTVVLQKDSTSVKHTVVVQAGVVAALVAPVAPAAPPPGPVSGWVSLRAPFTVEILEDGRLVGSSDAARVMLTAGRHDLQFVNEQLGLRVARSVEVVPGRVTPLTFPMPQGVVHLNASPWAEVWIDGQRVGDTPLGNISLPIGPHEIAFRHPQLGEKRHAVSVTVGAPVRLSVNMK
jgi:hypothetical protein